MQTSDSGNWSRLDALLNRSCEVLRNIFKQRWLRCTGTIWDDTPQSSEAFLREPFGKAFKSQNKVQKQCITDGDTNQWDISMLAAILITWTMPTSSSLYHLIKTENQLVENVRNVRNFFSHLPTHHVDEANFKQKRSILIASLAGLGGDPTELEQLQLNSTTARMSLGGNTPLINDAKSSTTKQDAHKITSKTSKETSHDCCSCGFDIKRAIMKTERGQSFRHYCPNSNKLDNHVDCPCFRLICHENEPDEPYYKWYDSCVTQNRHWCLMGEIEHVSHFIRTSLFIRTRFDEDVAVHFYLDKDQQPKTFSFNDTVAGNVILIMYADRHDFLDMTTGIRQENPDTVVIFRCSMRELIKTFASVISSSQCFQCHATASANQSLQRCSKCRLALYCGKECQTQHWKDTHKQLCSSMKYLDKLHRLDFTRMKQTSDEDGQFFSFA